MRVSSLSLDVSVLGTVPAVSAAWTTGLSLRGPQLVISEGLEPRPENLIPNRNPLTTTSNWPPRRGLELAATTLCSQSPRRARHRIPFWSAPFAESWWGGSRGDLIQSRSILENLIQQSSLLSGLFPTSPPQSTSTVLAARSTLLARPKTNSTPFSRHHSAPQNRSSCRKTRKAASTYIDPQIDRKVDPH